MLGYLYSKLTHIFALSHRDGWMDGVLHSLLLYNRDFNHVLTYTLELKTKKTN